MRALIQIAILLSVLSILVVVGCKTKKEDLAVPAGMMPLDLTANGLPIIINVPDSTRGVLNVVTQSWGATEIRVGKGFQISIAEGEKYNEKLFKLLGQYTDKDPVQVLSDANRDLWLDAEEALKYGIIDGVITTKKKK